MGHWDLELTMQRATTDLFLKEYLLIYFKALK